MRKMIKWIPRSQSWIVLRIQGSIREYKAACENDDKMDTEITKQHVINSTENTRQHVTDSTENTRQHVRKQHEDMDTKLRTQGNM